MQTRLCGWAEVKRHIGRSPPYVARGPGDRISPTSLPIGIEVPILQRAAAEMFDSSGRLALAETPHPSALGTETGSIGLRAWHAVRVLSGPRNKIRCLSILIFSTPPEIPTGSETISAQITKSSQRPLRQAGRARRCACRSCRQRKVSTHDVCFRSMIGHSLATSAVSEICHELTSCSGWKSIRSTTMERLDRRAVQAEARACCIGMET